MNSKEIIPSGFCLVPNQKEKVVYFIFRIPRIVRGIKPV